MTHGLLAWGSKCDLLVTQQKRCLRSSNGKSRIAHTKPFLITMNQLKLVDMYNSKLLKLYYKLYRNQLPCYFNKFFPTYGMCETTSTICKGEGISYQKRRYGY